MPKQPKITMPKQTQVTPYQTRVYTLLQQIPEGKVTSYAALARALNSSPRAVGGALRCNPFAPKVPCHRCVASTGVSSLLIHLYNVRPWFTVNGHATCRLRILYIWYLCLGTLLRFDSLLADSRAIGRFCPGEGSRGRSWSY
jgi:O-6-methylguanine DNA methyltransferase